MIIEGVAWERLDGLVADAFDPYWRITLDFLTIAVSAPGRSGSPNTISSIRATRVAQAVEKENRGAERWSFPAAPRSSRARPGTNRATARLIGAVARAPEGAVVYAGPR